MEQKRGRGRPPFINRRITIPNPDGTGDRTVSIAEYIHEQIRRVGISPSLAGRAAGVSSECVWQWIREGRKAVSRRDAGQEITSRDERLADFVKGCDQSFAQYVAEQLDIHHRLARGDILTGEVVEKVDPTRRGEDGGPLVLERRVTRRRTIPDAASIRWNLAHLAKAEGFADALEISGPDGGPVEVDDTAARARALVEQARAFQQGVYERGVRDAERVEEGSSANGSAPVD